MRLDLLENRKDISFARFLLAMEIPRVGRTVCKALVDKYSMSEFESAVWKGDNLTKCRLDQETNACICDWFQKNKEQWEAAKREYPITVIGVRTDTVKTPRRISTLVGANIAVTGTLCSMTRFEVEEYINSLGAIYNKSVTRRTQLLVVGDNPGETKQRNASKYGVPVWDEAEFLRETKR